MLLVVVNGTVVAPLAVLGEAGSATISALGTITTFAYFTALEAHSGQTLGKKALGLVVVSHASDASVTSDDDQSRVGEEGGAPDVAAVAIRNLLRYVDWLPAFYLLGAVVVSVTDRDQRLGDLAADTLVVRVGDSDGNVAGGRNGDDGGGVERDDTGGREETARPEEAERREETERPDGADGRDESDER